MERVTKSLKIDPEVWKAVKVHCAKEDLEISDFIETIVKKELGKK